jgi:hypothetical protein
VNCRHLATSSFRLGNRPFGNLRFDFTLEEAFLLI